MLGRHGNGGDRMEKDAQVNETSGLYYKIKSTWTQAILIFKL